MGFSNIRSKRWFCGLWVCAFYCRTFWNWLSPRVLLQGAQQLGIWEQQSDPFLGKKKKKYFDLFMIYWFQWTENEISNNKSVLIMISVHDLFQKRSFSSLFEDLGWWQCSFPNKTHFSLDKLTLILSFI